MSNHNSSTKNGTGKGNEKYHAAMEILYADGEWFRLPKLLHKITPSFPLLDKNGNGTGRAEKNRLGMVVYTLASLLNQSAVKRAVSNNDGWFIFSADIAEEETGFSRDKQHDHLTKLQQCNLIDVRRSKSRDGRREIKINYNLLVDLLIKADQEGGCGNQPQPRGGGCGNQPQPLVGISHNQGGVVVADSHNPIDKKEIQERKKELSPAGPGTVHTGGTFCFGGNTAVDKESTPAVDIAKELWAILVSHNKVARKELKQGASVSIQRWAPEIAVLIKEYSEREVLAAIQWMDDCWKSKYPYVPKIHSGTALRQRFDDLRDAMERKSNTEAYENTKRRQRSQRYGYISEEEWSGNDYQDDAPAPPRKKPRRAVDETDEERKERLRNERLESLSDEEFREYNRACDRGDRGADEFWAKYGL